MNQNNANDKTDQTELTDVLIKEEEVLYRPNAGVIERATVKNWEEEIVKAEKDPLEFWEEAAKELEWIRPWKKVLDDKKKPNYVWFKGSKCNIFNNALERHQKTEVRDKLAIISETETGEVRKFTYKELYDEVNKFAAALKKLGIKKGDRVTVYLPNIPETAITMLACAKIGAIHSVVYAGFSYSALRDRINDAGSKILVTANGGFRRGKVIKLKDTADQAVAEECPSIEHLIVVRHAKDEVIMKEGRDLWFDELVKNSDGVAETEAMKSGDPLFILYTSGTTAKPKGVVHDHAGYMTGVNRTFRWVFDVKNEDIYWCTADPGWITGHSYIIYGPLMAGLTSIMYEGVPDYPAEDRIWSMVEKYKVSILYTAPTLVRMMMKYGEEPPAKHDLSTLRLLGSVGEPINPEAWKWFYKVIGKERCPIMDTWWQTETGMFMICPLPSASLKAGSATKPFPGILAAVVDREGNPVPEGKGGFLVIKNTWPAMLTTLWQNPKRYKETYFEKIPNVYTTGDLARVDKDGYFWLQGRADDVMNISGHRIGTAEIESALASHEAVLEAGVIGKPHPVKGETAKAFVILKQGFSPSDELVDSLKKQIRKVMGPIAIVEEISFVDKLPKTRSGKIMRRVLKAQELGLPVGDISTLED